MQLVRFSADRPFSPERLHAALDVLLDGVLTSRGRLWLASQHDRARWLESAGGGLRIEDAGHPEHRTVKDPPGAVAAPVLLVPVTVDGVVRPVRRRLRTAAERGLLP